MPFRFASYNASSARRNSVCGSLASSGQAAHPKLALSLAAHSAPPSDRLLERRLDAADDVTRILLGRLCDEDGELVAADAECVVRFPQRLDEHVRECDQRVVPAGMAEAVVELLEAVEIRDHEPKVALVANGPRDLALEAGDERAPVEQARERIVVGEEPQFPEMPAGDERSGRIVGEDPERLEAVGRRHEPVGGVVHPDDPEQRPLSVLERNEQPVPVPRPRPVAVELRRVDVDVDAEPCPRLLVREEIAALPQEHLVQQGLRLGEGHGLASEHVLELPARGRLGHERAGLRVDERTADVPEVEGFADSSAHLAQDLGVGRFRP